MTTPTPEEYRKLHATRLRDLERQAELAHTDPGSDRDLDIRAHRALLGVVPIPTTAPEPMVPPRQPAKPKAGDA